MRHTDRKACADSLRAWPLCVTWALFVLPKLWIVLHGKPIADHGSNLDRILNHGFWNALGARLIMGATIGFTFFTRRGVIGVFGLLVLFRAELLTFEWRSENSLALLFCLIGTVSASSGNLVSAWLQRRSMTVWNSTAYGMLYGTLLTFGFAVMQCLRSSFEWTVIYVGSLLYL